NSNDVGAMQPTCADGTTNCWAQWSVYMAESLNGNAAFPSFTQHVASDHFIHAGTVCTNGTGCSNGDSRALADCFQVALDTEPHLPDQSHPGVSRCSAPFVFCRSAAYPAQLFQNNEETPCPVRSAKSANRPASAQPKAKKFARSAAVRSAKSPWTARPTVLISSPPTATKTAISAPCPRTLRCSRKKSPR